MTLRINVACDGDWEEPEVLFSGSVDALVDFGLALNSATELNKYDLSLHNNEYYPASIKTLILEPSKSGNDRITVFIEEGYLRIVGSSVALNKLGDSLLNFFDDNTSVGEHFQLDYYEGNKVLNETKCLLIFMCDR